MYSLFGRLSPVAEPDIRYSREMGLTHGDFWRLLPRAMGEYPYTRQDDSVVGTVHEGTVQIDLGVPQERRIALLRIPFSEVSFHFKGVSEAQQQAFKQYFDLRFQRGGG